MKGMEVSIIIPSRDEEKNIGKCLSGVYSQDVGFNFEVIVIDSGSRDNTIEIAKQFPIELIHIKPDEFHHGRTRNLGAKLAKGKILVYLNADAYPADQRWLLNLLKPLKDEKVAAVYGRQIPPEGTNPINRFRIERLYGNERLVNNINCIRNHKCFFFSTVNCAIKKKIWEQFHFPESVPTAEDATFAKSILTAGYTIIYEPLAKVFHAHNYTVKGILKRYFDTGAIWKEFNLLRQDELPIEGVKYILAELRFLLEEGLYRWIPYALIHDMAKAIGLFLGRHKEFLPPSLRRVLSAQGKA